MLVSKAADAGNAPLSWPKQVIPRQSSWPQKLATVSSLPFILRLRSKAKCKICTGSNGEGLP
jgi:hypothetical protein